MFVSGEESVDRMVIAAQAGDTATIQAFLEAGGGVDTRDSRMGMVSLGLPSLNFFFFFAYLATVFFLCIFLTKRRSGCARISHTIACISSVLA